MPPDIFFSSFSAYKVLLFFNFKENNGVFFHSGSNTWVIPETRGAIPQGGYGHSSTYDTSTGSVYVHGGYKALPANKYGLVDDLYRYDVDTRTW